MHSYIYRDTLLNSTVAMHAVAIVLSCSVKVTALFDITYISMLIVILYVHAWYVCV